MAIKRNVLAESGATVQAEDGTTMYATIQMRHGKESDMDKSKFVPAEMGVATDTKKAFMAFGSNQVKEMMFREDSEIEELLGEVREISDKAVEAVESAEATAKQAIEDYTDQMKATIPEDYTEMVKKVDVLERTKAPAIMQTVSGESLQIEVTADAPVAGLKVYGKGIQNGTPTPDSPVNIEIPGSEGNIELQILSANIYNNSERNFSSNVQTSSILEKTDTGLKFEIIKAGASSGVFKSDVFPDNFSGYVSFDVVVSNRDFQYFVSCFENRTESSDFSAGRSKHIAFKLEEYNSKSLTFYLNTETTGTVVEIKNIMITTGNEDREFQPYSYSAITFSTQNGLPGIPVDSDGNYTDSDGQQWICDEVDFDRGKYVQRVKKLELLSSSNWMISSSGYRIYFTLSDGVIMLHSPVISNYFVVGYWNDDKAGTIALGNSAQAVIGVSTQDFEDIDAFKAWLDEKSSEGDPCYVIYPLATPIETDLSEEELTAYAALRTNYPTTVVTSDSDPEVGIEVEYVADTQKYIDNKFAELAQNLAATQSALLEV